MIHLKQSINLNQVSLLIIWPSYYRYSFYKTHLFVGRRALHTKYDPAKIASNIKVTEDVTLKKLGFANKNEIASLSNEEVVNLMNAKLLEIFGVKSKEEIGYMESKEIIAKLDSVFKSREDNQPNVANLTECPVSKISIH